MDYLWSPWRFRYVSQGAKHPNCFFCDHASADASRDRENLILYRDRSNFILLNLYPYTTGHALVAPYAHVANLDEVDGGTLAEMITLAQRYQVALKQTYKPQGYNLGMNLGESAGAGIADHLHLHVLPRWTGDTNFITTVGETRVQPEDILTTYDKLVGFFRR